MVGRRDNGPILPFEAGFEPGCPTHYWDDFGMDDWIWVSQRLLASDLAGRLLSLSSLLDGTATVRMLEDLEPRDEPLSILDPVVQETLWSLFFSDLSELTAFGEGVKAYHAEKYRCNNERRPSTPSAVAAPEVAS